MTGTARLRRLGPCVAAVALLVSACSDGASKPTSGAASSATTQDPPAMSDGSVNIVSFAFAPKTLRVAAGSTVRWFNQDDAIHSVVAADRKLFDSGVMKQGAEFEFEADSAGTISYICGVHQYMTGEIVVS